MIERSRAFRRFLYMMFGALVVHAYAASVLSDVAPSPVDLYNQLVSQYMAGKWDGLSAKLTEDVPRLKSLTAAQKANLDYIHQTLHDCAPEWWTECEAGHRTRITSSIFGQPLDAVYDPQQKQSLNLRFTGSDKEVTLGWTAADMVSTQQAEHGFTKGELAGMGVWSTLGIAATYVQMPLETLTNQNEKAKLTVSRVLEFRGDVAAAYYGNPRSRQWCLFLSLHFYQPRYQKLPTVMGRRALGAMFVAELAAHPDQYPSIQLPATLASTNAEVKLVTAVANRIEKHGWTLAEDESIRAAVKRFALANAPIINTGGPMHLENGLLVGLDPQDDASLQLKRDAWLAAEFGRN